jgi:hypothetical protein
VSRFTLPPRLQAAKEYSVSDLRRALETMAKVITLYGEKYLPIFERIERELDAAEQREITRLKVKSLAERV